jgi:hypothetical protein
LAGDDDDDNHNRQWEEEVDNKPGRKIGDNHHHGNAELFLNVKCMIATSVIINYLNHLSPAAPILAIPSCLPPLLPLVFCSLPCHLSSAATSHTPFAKPRRQHDKEGACCFQMNKSYCLKVVKRGLLRTPIWIL